MPSRQDQLHSYQFMIQRVVAALVMRETDPAQSPFRRIAGATLIGALLAALSLGAVAAYGLIAPGGSGKWKNESAVIMEKGSGALYVYRNGVLHPVINYASARLIVSSAGAKTVSVARRSIENVPRGAPLGITGAPTSLPAKGKLLKGAWTVCSHRPEGSDAQSVLFVGSTRAAGTGLGDRALLVATPDNTAYLLWKQRRYLVRGDVLPSLLLNRTKLQVATALINALPAGVDLARPSLPDRGSPAALIPTAKVGNVYVVPGSGGGEEYYVAMASGPQRITVLQRDLLLSDPASTQRTALQLTRQNFGQYTANYTVPEFAGTSGPGALPPTVPALADNPTGGVCTEVSGPGQAGEIRLDAPLPDLAAATVTGARSAAGGALADRVVVPPGRAVLASAVSSPTATTGTLSLITELGVRHVIPSTQAADSLGYSGQQPVRLPEDLVALLPAGAPLDPVRALQPANAPN